MSRSKVGHISSLTVALILTFATPQIASARPLASAHPLAGPPAVDTATAWMESVAHWIAGLFAGHAPVANQTARSTSVPALPSGTAHINTGTCIDPNGHPVPCSP